MKPTTGTRVGLFFVLGVVMILVIIEMFGTATFRRGYFLHAYFQNAREIKVGSPVKMGGVPIGKVTSISLAQPGERGRVKMDLKINLGVEIPTDSVASIQLSSIFGENFVDISFGSSSTVHLSHTTIQTRERTDINAMLDKMDEVATDLRGLTKQLSENPLAPLTDFFQDNKDRFSSLLTNTEEISNKVNRGEGTLGRLVNDPSLFDEAKKTLEDFGKTTDDLQQIGDNLKAITGDIREGKGTIGKFFTEEELYESLNDGAKHLKEILRKINEGEGSIGELVNDPSLVRNAKVSLQKLNKATDVLEDQGPLTVISILAGALF